MVEDIAVDIGKLNILKGVSLAVENGVTALLGRNSAGKTVTLNTVMGYWPVRRGRIEFLGASLVGLPTHRIARQGIVYVPPRGVFHDLSVELNLSLAIGSRAYRARREYVFSILTELKDILKMPAGCLSGGQQQIVAMARALFHGPRLLLLDEPSRGLAPVIIQRIGAVIREMARQMPILLVEQNFTLASELARDFYILDDGRTVYAGTIAELAADDELKRRYLAIG